jgi:hypothetical protein
MTVRIVTNGLSRRSVNRRFRGVVVQKVSRVSPSQRRIASRTPVGSAFPVIRRFKLVGRGRVDARRGECDGATTTIAGTTT